jgi:uncharacterized protein (DUF2147 family)
MKKMILATLVALVSSSASAQAPSIMGTWLTASGVAKVRIGPCTDAAAGPICGFIVGLVNPKGPDGQVVAPDAATDYRNSNPELRSRKVIGMPLIWGFRKTSDPNAFEEGQIYNGENGKTYKANISLQADGTLRLRGYVGSPMLGETQIWTRVNQ